MTNALYFEDFAVGQIFQSGSAQIDAAGIKRFAAEFDPQPFHLDETAANASFFAGLAASGWHTAAITMRLWVAGGLPIAGGIIGAGGDEIRWMRPVRPGDSLSVRTEVIGLRPSKSNAEFGLLKLRATTSNQDGDPVQEMVGNILAPRRTVVDH